MTYRTARADELPVSAPGLLQVLYHQLVYE